jgi:putative oxidoreductase
MNTQMNSGTSPAPVASSGALMQTIVQKLNAIPYSVIALIARAATFSVFFRSGTQKLSDWNSTLMLFQNEYHVPILPPNIAAY